MNEPSPPISCRALHILLFCLFMVFLCLPQNGSSETLEEREQQKAEVNQGIKKYRINIRRLQQGIKQQKEQVKKTRQQERNLLAELEDIDTRLAEQQEKLTVLESRMRAQKKLIVVKKHERDRARKEKSAVQAHLQKRIKAYYKMGNIGFINVTFSTKTLPEMLRFHTAFRDLIKYDQGVIDTYRHTIEELERALDSLKLEQTMLDDFITKNEIERQKIDLLRQEKELLLARIRTQTKLHEQAIAEMEDASRNLSSTLQVLKNKEELLDKSFQLHKGKLPPPVQGVVISHFQEKTSNRLGITSISKGIAIDAPPGTLVHAVHDGTVSFSGYLRGYGNTVIVNHGYQYYSITSRIDRLLAVKDQPVDERSEIGIMGETATLMNEGLYFEIRHGSENLDPLDWLDASQLQQDAP